MKGGGIVDETTVPNIDIMRMHNGKTKDNIENI